MKLPLPIIMLTLLLLPSTAMAGSSSQPQDDPSRSPIYSRYHFAQGQRVINFGTQPVFVPAGVIGEVMRRDRILRQELRKQGFQIVFHPFLKGSDINFFLQQGKISAAMAGDMPTIMAAATSDIVVPALVQQGFSSIVMHTFTTIDALQGKRIAYTPFSNAHYALLSALSSVGLKDKDVRMVPMNVNEMARALATGEIDGFAAWEPEATIARKSTSGSMTIYRHLNSGYLYFSRGLADPYPDAAAAILASMVRAFNWMKRDQGNLHVASGWLIKASAGLLGKPIALSAEDVAVLTLRDLLDRTSKPTIPENDLTDRGSIRRELDFLISTGILPATTSAEKILHSFDRKMLTTVLAQPKKYRLASYDYDAGEVDK